MEDHSKAEPLKRFGGDRESVDIHIRPDTEFPGRLAVTVEIDGVTILHLVRHNQSSVLVDDCRSRKERIGGLK